jgi:hypothetical protein
MSSETKIRPELVEGLAELARLTGSTPEELTAAAGEYQRRLAELRALVNEGLESGEPLEGAAVFARLRAKYQGMAEAADATEPSLPGS